MLQAAVLAFPDEPRGQRMARLVDHQRRCVVRRSPAARKLWAEASEALLYSLALRRAARMFAELARRRPRQEELQDAAADLATVLAFPLERRGC